MPELFYRRRTSDWLHQIRLVRGEVVQNDVYLLPSELRGDNFFEKRHKLLTGAACSGLADKMERNRSVRSGDPHRAAVCQAIVHEIQRLIFVRGRDLGPLLTRPRPINRFRLPSTGRRPM
jgi:hypothetical protein